MAGLRLAGLALLLCAALSAASAAAAQVHTI
jgi:hypothetical protein